MNERNLKFILKVGMYFLPITSKQRMFTRTRRSTTYSLTRSLARTKMPKLFAGFVVIIFIHFLIIIFLLSYRDPFTFTEILSAKFFRPPRFHKPNITAHVPCHKFFDPEYDRFYLAKKYRITYKESENKEEWPTDCGSIRSRNFFANKPMSEEERNFSIAYARNVYRDYRFLEMTLATTYAPQNFYCYSVDGKASELFRKRMNDLASCLPNVHVTDFAAVMDSFGHNTNSHHMECLKWLAHKNRKWKYVMLLQNFDVPLKTNQEMVQILNWYNGSNDVTTQYRLNWPHNNTWTFNAIKLFKDPARNNLTVNGDPPFFFFSRSPVEVTMSREAIDFILEKMDLRSVIAQFNSYPVTAIDEFVTSSINSNDNIGLPGGFTQKCYKQARTVIEMTRFGVWWKDKNKCDSQIWRHDVCILGLEDLITKFTNNSFFTANKLMPEHDFGAIVCWNEVLFNRTFYERGIHRLDKEAYVKLPAVRLNNARKKYGKKFNISRFKCNKFLKDTIGTVASEWE